MVRDILIKSCGTVKINGQTIYEQGVIDIAKSEGFGSKNEFIGFMDELYGLPFSGVKIDWIAPS